MKKLSVIAIALAFFLGLTVIASAAVTQPRPPGTTVPGGGPACIGDCGDTTETGEPFNPNFPGPECQINCGSAEIPEPECQINCDNSGIPGKPQGGALAADGCGDKLGYLRDVTVGQIEGVGTDDLVDIVPVCRSKSLAAEQEDVAQLRPVIGQNPVLDQVLDRKGYNPEDVVGVIVDGQQVVLYVHRS